MDQTVDSVKQLMVLAAELSERSENEADTRHRLIDVVLHEVLGWPRNRVRVEQYIHPGFADYVLTRGNGNEQLFIEAKRAGVYFELPISHKADEKSCYIAVSRLLSDPAIKEAMNQVRAYCTDSGCEFGCITNGHEWIFFRTFSSGKRWDALQAFVIRSIDFFEAEYTKAYNTLSFSAVTENGSLSGLLTDAPVQDRPIFYAKDRIPAYSHAIHANKLAPVLRPVASHYFGVIGDDDTEFMDRCYVSQRDYNEALKGVRGLLQDSLSPYFQAFGVQQLDDTGKGGRLGGRLTKSLKRDRRGEVLVLFGGKGSGKSTFIKRLLHHKPPPWLRDHAVIVIVDLLKVPEDTSVIRSTIWTKLVKALDPGGLLNGSRDEIINALFRDRFHLASKQELAGLNKTSEAYNLRLNELFSVWKDDYPYLAGRLVTHWHDQDKGIIVVIDNTDQFSGDIQDYCFTSSQEIADLLGCVTLISMREERFHNSKIHGLLDAFQNAGFHISSPKPAVVFRKRLDYAVHLLRNPARRARITEGKGEALAANCATYLEIVSREFGSERSPLNAFLTACAHGDTRLSLDLFRSFLLSGYTNVDEMIAAGGWNFQIHQVIKPVMVPNRYFYDEKLSDIPDIYQLRYARHASHFTALRILRLLSKSADADAAGYIAMAELKAYFASTFSMLEDFVRNIDILLKRGFVESNNRLDKYDDTVDSVKITAYGQYMFSSLAFEFTYLDLVCVDCGVFSEEVSNFLTSAANTEYRHFTRDERVERVRVRLDRVEKFISYLQTEERRERDTYGLSFPDSEMFSHRAATSFATEKTRVLASAMRQASKPGRTGR